LLKTFPPCASAPLRENLPSPDRATPRDPASSVEGWIPQAPMR
jgi:hypothetical protein